MDDVLIWSQGSQEHSAIIRTVCQPVKDGYNPKFNSKKLIKQYLSH